MVNYHLPQGRHCCRQHQCRILHNGKLVRSLAAETLSHELTHFIEQYAKEEYQALRDAVIEVMYKGDPELFAERVKKQREMLPPNYKVNEDVVKAYISQDMSEADARDQALNDAAMREVVADACTQMLKNSKMVTELARQNMDLAHKVADFIDQTVEKIRSTIEKAFSESDPEFYRTEATLILDEMVRIQKLWDAGLKAATKNYNALQGDSKNAAREGGVQYSIANTRKMSWDEQMEAYFGKGNARLKSSDSLYLGESEGFINEVISSPLYIPTSVVNKAMRAQRGSRSAHELTEGDIRNLQKGIKEASAVIYDPDRNAIVYIAQDGEHGGHVVVSFDLNNDLYGENAHKATSIHPRDSIIPMLEKLGKDATIYVLNENKFNDLAGLQSDKSPELLAKIELVHRTITDTAAESNGQEQLQVAIPDQISLDDWTNGEYSNSNLHPRIRERIEAAAEIEKSIRDYFHTVSQKSEFWLSDEEIDDLMDFDVFSNSMNGAGEIIENLSDISKVRKKGKTAVYELMDSLLPYVSVSTQDTWIEAERSKDPAFAEWYNEKHPSLYYPGYRAGDLPRGHLTGENKENVAKEIKYLKELLQGNKLNESERAEAQKLLDGLEAGEVQYQISEGMTDEERYEELKDSIILVHPDSHSSEHAEELSSLKVVKAKAESIIIPLAKQLGIINKELKTPDVSISFLFSKTGGLSESLSKQLRYGGDYEDFAKALVNLEEILGSAKLIEVHTDKYKGTVRENPNLINTYVLLGAFSSEGHIIPVQFEIKNASDFGGRLYLTVALTKIQADVLERTSGKDASTSNLISAEYSLADIVREINPKDKHFLKYLPDQMLSEEQLKGKYAALEEDQKRIDSYERKKSNKDSEVFQMADVTADDTALESGSRQKAWNDLRAENEILRETTEQLNREIAKLTKRNDKLGRELKRTTTPEIRLNDAKKLAREIVAMTQREAVTTRDKQYNREMADELAGRIKAVADYIVQSGENIDYDKVTEMAYEIAHDIVSNAEAEIDDGGATKEMRELMQAALKGRAIYVPPNVRADTLDWNAFKKAHRDIFTFRDNGLDIDIVYESLLQEVPGLLDPNINNPGDMLNEMAEKWDLLQPKYENPYEHYENEATSLAEYNVINNGLILLNIKHK